MSAAGDDQPITRAVLHAELNEVRAEFNSKIDAVIGSVDHLRGEMGHFREDMGHFQGEMGHFREDMGHLRDEMGHLRDDLVEQMRDMQTEVLRAFHSWARPIEIRLRSFDDMQQRLGLLEERVSAIERGDQPAA